MDLLPVLIILSISVIVGGIFLVIKKSNSQTSSTETTVNVREDNPAPRAVRRQADAMARMRRRGAQDDASDDDDDEPNRDISEKVSKKSQKKDEKKAMAEARRAAIEAKKEREAEKIAWREEKDAEREEKRRLEEEEEERLKQEKLKAEEEEYAKWKDMFSVDESGEASNQHESDSMLQEFVDYIKRKKVVMLDELGRAFKLRTEDAITRVKDLEAMGRISGVIDERGKFIYITRAELDAVAQYIQREGRVSIRDIASESNKLINLDAVEDEIDLSPDNDDQEGTDS